MNKTELRELLLDFNIIDKEPIKKEEITEDMDVIVGQQDLETYIIKDDLTAEEKILALLATQVKDIKVIKGMITFFVIIIVIIIFLTLGVSSRL